MSSYFRQTALYSYVFGRRAADNETKKQKTSLHPPDLPTKFSDKAADKSTAVALPRLKKGAIQHEMIVMYLYQQQRQRFWISDSQSSDEGAFMRETWSDYITAPAALSQSLLADALVDLNAEVRFNTYFLTNVH